MISLHRFKTPEDASRYCAEIAEQALCEGLEMRGTASLFLSGGGTPRTYVPCVFLLDLPWPQVRIYQVDERLGSLGGPASNAGMLKPLLKGTPAECAQTNWLENQSDANSSAVYAADLKVTGDSFDLVFLGMGEDGHIASLFPNAQGEQPNSEEHPWWVKRPCPPLPHPQYERLTLSPGALKRAQKICIVISGRDKLCLWRDVMRDGRITSDYPVSILNDCKDVTAIWFP